MSSPSVSPGVSALASGFLEGLDPALTYAWAGVACLVALVIYTSTRPKNPYDAIPAIGRTGFFTSYLDAVRFFKHGKEILQEGYDKYHPGAFRFPELNRWHVVVVGEQLTEELRKAPDHSLSFGEAVRDTLATDWTLGPTIGSNPYHVGIVRAQLTRNLGNLFPDVRKEIELAFEDNVPVTEDWTKVKAFDTVMKIVSRTSNRVFVGVPLCRDPEFLSLNVKFTIDVVIGSKIINLFPDFLKPIAGRLFTNVPSAIETAMKHLKPIIEERQLQIDEYGLDYPDKPTDMLSWLMDEAQGEERSTRNLTLRILTLNFAAIHTSTMSFTHALYELASRPEYIQPIREEVEAVIAQDGWSKVAMTRMRKLDSFLKENQRLTGLGTISMSRVALEDFTFSDGTRIPKGGTVSAVTTPRHLDNNVYPDAATFQGFRFSDMREEDGQGTKNQMVATSADYLPFGHGRHACPGRFFAANELKAMMAHIVLMYDIMIPSAPKSLWYGSSCIPDSKAEVLFRKRQV